MRTIEDVILKRAELEERVASLAEDRDLARQHFGRLLGSAPTLRRASQQADLSTLTGRIIRSCLLDIFDIVHRACDDESMRTHMFLVTRNGVSSMEGDRLTPASTRIFDGWSDIMPQKDYVNNWDVQISAELLREQLSPHVAEPSGVVRSFRCFRAAYFEKYSKFAVSIPVSGHLESVDIEFSDSTKDTISEVDHRDWETQTSLPGAILAFSKFTQKQFKATHEELKKSLYLVAVGSHSLPYGRRADEVPGSHMLSTVQSIWIVLSVDDKSKRCSDILRRLASCLPEIDAKLIQSLVFNLLHRQEVLYQEREADKRELDNLKDKIDEVKRSFDVFSAEAGKIFGSVMTSAAALRALANDLSKSLFDSDSTGKKFQSAANPKHSYEPIHGVDLNPDLFKSEIHGPELHERMVIAFRGAEHDVDRFEKYIDNPLKRLLWVKKHVYAAYADGKIGEEKWMTVGALRAALRWRVRAEDDGKLDDKLLLQLRTDSRDQKWVDDPRGFYSVLAALAEIWLEPGSIEARWLTLNFKPADTFRRLEIGGGSPQRQINEDRLRALPRRLDELIKEGRREHGGNFTRTLLQLRLSSALAPAQMEHVRIELEGRTAWELRVSWPAYEGTPSDRQCQVALRYESSTVKSLHLQLPYVKQ